MGVFTRVAVSCGPPQSCFVVVGAAAALSRFMPLDCACTGFVSVTFDLLTGAISALSGDLSGGGNFVTNLAAPTTPHGGPGGLALEVEFADLSSTSSSGCVRRRVPTCSPAGVPARGLRALGTAAAAGGAACTRVPYISCSWYRTSFTRTAPLAYTVLANTSSAAAFSVKVSSSATNPVAEAV